jgi:hypothetical protein
MLWDVFSNFYWACPRNRLLPYWGWLNLDDMFPERSFLNHQCTIAGHFPPHLLQAVDSLFFSPYFNFFCKCILLVFIERAFTWCNGILLDFSTRMQVQVQELPLPAKL